MAYRFAAPVLCRNGKALYLQGAQGFVSKIRKLDLSPDEKQAQLKAKGGVITGVAAAAACVYMGLRGLLLFWP